VGGLSLPSAFTVLTEYNRTSAAQNGGVMRTAPVAVGTYVAVDAQDNNTTGWWASGLAMSGSIVGVNKTALAVNSSGTARASRNGGAVVSSSVNDYVGGATSIQLGINRATGVYLNDYLRRVVIYPGILPDARLQAITS
jgi:hypothetical protein